MSLKDKVTLIIPTHYRHDYLERLLEYYIGCDFTILVADSSYNIFKKVNNYKMNYYHYPDMNYFEKMNDIFKKVKTEYVLLCADDDFIVKEGLHKCIDFLEKNKDYSSVQGQYISFYKYNNEYEFKAKYFNTKDLNINSDKIDVRMNEMMNNYAQVYYSVNKTDIIQRFFSDCFNNKMDNPILLEIGLCLYILTSGKYKSLNIFYSARDSESTSTTSDRTTLDLIVANDKYLPILNKFKNMLKLFINSKKTEVDPLNMINNCIQIYCDKLTISKIEKRKQARLQKKNNIDISIQEEKRLRKKLERKKILRNKNLLLPYTGYPISDDSSIKEWEEILVLLDKYNI